MYFHWQLTAYRGRLDDDQENFNLLLRHQRSFSTYEILRVDFVLSQGVLAEKLLMSIPWSNIRNTIKGEIDDKADGAFKGLFSDEEGFAGYNKIKIKATVSSQ